MYGLQLKLNGAVCHDPRMNQRALLGGSASLMSGAMLLT